MTPQIFFSKHFDMGIKKRIIEKVVKNSYKKVISIIVQKLCTFSSFSTEYISSQHSNFLCVNFLDTFSTVRNRHKILHFLIYIENIWEKFSWGHIISFCKLISQTRSKKLKTLKNFFFIGHRIQFCIYLWVRTFNFFKNSQNCCS